MIHKENSLIRVVDLPSVTPIFSGLLSNNKTIVSWYEAKSNKFYQY